MEKPKILYTATHTSGLQELVPTRGRYRDINEGPVIFATPYKALASVFLVKDHEGSWMKISYFSDMLCAVFQTDRDTFIQQDRGGVMYEVPSDTFGYDPNIGMGEKEWTSKVPVTVLRETSYPSAFDAMIENGVNVYFVDTDTFQALKNADDYGLSIIRSLVSENSRRN